MCFNLIIFNLIIKVIINSLWFIMIIIVIFVSNYLFDLFYHLYHFQVIRNVIHKLIINLHIVPFIYWSLHNFVNSINVVKLKL